MKTEKLRRVVLICAAALCIPAVIFVFWERPSAQAVTPEAAESLLSGSQRVLVGDQWHETGGDVVSVCVMGEEYLCPKSEALAAVAETERWKEIGCRDQNTVKKLTERKKPLLVFQFGDQYELHIYTRDYIIFYNGYAASAWENSAAYYQVERSMEEICKEEKLPMVSRLKDYVRAQGERLRA